ncbi:hypothetical protein EPUL_003753 [Erysiphe pulchra]|uniref:Amino acid transporter transmembrane domain-containing protein n=1 Tax=Erysiphe pulchra TaxID=225359 RepID=A0A2S4PTX6_9PEZI|nr:hypothetical protein EPUL_003753 [Erysiphe pulchra]
MSQQNPTNSESSHNEVLRRGSIASHNGGSLRLNNPIDPPSETSALLEAPGEFVGASSGERPSGTFRMNSITQVGGVNSIENFARSWTRAASFIEAIPQETSFVLEDDLGSRRDEDSHWSKDGIDSSGLLGTSTLRSNLDVGSSRNAIQRKWSPPNSQTNSNLEYKKLDSFRIKNDTGGLSNFKDSTSADARQRRSSLFGSYGSSYEVLQSNLRANSMGNAGRIWRQQQDSKNQDPSQGGPNERAPVLLKEVEQDGKMVLMISGQSTLPQTIFNSTNVLIGIGILSLPMGFKYAGWIPGIIILSLAALVTSLTANLLAKCIDVDPSLITFADIALISYGEKARNLTSLLFTLELVAACVGSIVLFADTLNFLIPGIDLLAAAPGILMFGAEVTNEITANVLNTPGYPRFFSIFLSIAIAIIPITKIPLNSSPLIATAESLTGLRASGKYVSDNQPTLSTVTRDFVKIAMRVAVTILFVLISVLFPNFDTIIGFMGSALCTTICVILPPTFYLKLFGNELSTKQKVFYYCLIIISTVIAIVGTIAAFLPRSIFAV